MRKYISTKSKLLLKKDGVVVEKLDVIQGEHLIDSSYEIVEVDDDVFNKTDIEISPLLVHQQKLRELNDGVNKINYKMINPISKILLDSDDTDSRERLAHLISCREEIEKQIIDIEEKIIKGR